VAGLVGYAAYNALVPYVPPEITPLKAPKMKELQEFGSSYQNNMLWGSYRSGLYFGMRTRCLKPEQTNSNSSRSCRCRRCRCLWQNAAAMCTGRGAAQVNNTRPISNCAADSGPASSCFECLSLALTRSLQNLRHHDCLQDSTAAAAWHDVV
jgi:hypothetical protein